MKYSRVVNIALSMLNINKSLYHIVEAGMFQNIPQKKSGFPFQIGLSIQTYEESFR